MAQQRDSDGLLLRRERSPGHRESVGDKAALGGQELLTPFGEREHAPAAVVLSRDAAQQTSAFQAGRLLGHRRLAQQRVRRNGADALKTAYLYSIQQDQLRHGDVFEERLQTSPSS